MEKNPRRNNFEQLTKATHPLMEKIKRAFTAPEKKSLIDFMKNIEATEVGPHQFAFFTVLLTMEEVPGIKEIGGKQAVIDTFGIDLAQKPLFVGVKPDENPQLAHYYKQTEIYATQQPGYYYLRDFKNRDSSHPKAKKESDSTAGANMMWLNMPDEGILKVGQKTEAYIAKAPPTFSIEDLGAENQVLSPREIAEEEYWKNKRAEYAKIREERQKNGE